MKKILAFVLCALLVTALAVPASAAGNDFLRSFYTTQGDNLVVFCGNPDGGSITVTANGEPITGFVQSTVEEQNVGITYFCIVDPSSSFSNNQKQAQKDALRAISANMRSIDRMVLAKMNQDSLSVGNILETKEACDAAINADWAVSWGTNLFTDVVSAMNAVKHQVTGLCCVILMTDGINEGKGTTPEQAQEAVKSSSVSFNTIALVNPYPDTYALRCADNALNMVDSPFRGLALTPVKQDMTAADAAQAIMQNMLKSLAICISTDKLDHSAEYLQIGVSVKNDKGSAQSSITVPAGDLPAPPAPPATEAPTVPPTEAETQPAVKDSLVGMSLHEAVDVLGNDVYYILIGGCVLVILAVSAILILFTRKRREDEENDLEIVEADDDGDEDVGLPEFMEKKQEVLSVDEVSEWERIAAELLGEKKAEEPVEVPVFEPIPEETAAPEVLFPVPETPEVQFIPEVKPSPIAAPEAEPEIIPVPEPVAEVKPVVVSVPVAVAEPAPIPEPGCLLKLIPTVDKSWAMDYFLPVNSAKTFGRSKRSDFILNETDFGLSGIHFEMMWDGRALFLRDKNSTNGTALNNVPLVPDKWARIKNGAVILAGAYEYRVNATKR